MQYISPKWETMFVKTHPQSTTTKHSLDFIYSLPECPTLDQFFESRQFRGCQKLIASILEDSFRCLVGNGYIDGLTGVALACKRGQMAKEAHSWICDDTQELGSFLWCCYSIGWQYPEQIRKRMLKHTNYVLISLSEDVKVSVWKTQEKSTIIKNNFRGSLEIAGKRTNVGSFPSRQAVIVALDREFRLRRKTWVTPILKNFTE